MKSIVLLAASTILSAASIAPAGVIASLSRDWSNVANPNTGVYGTWSYDMGSTPLTFHASLAGGINVAGWGTPQNVGGDFLPAAIKSTGLESGLDVQSGDVYIHTTDPANGVTNGVENGPLTLLWTSPIAGAAAISGNVWALRRIGRLNDYELIANPGAGQTVLTSGTIPEDGSNSRLNPISFSFPAISIAKGEAIEMLITQDRTSSFGDFAGVNLTIATVPEPASIAFAAAGIFLSLRRPRTHFDFSRFV